MNRDRLPDRRLAERFEFKVGNISYTAQLGYYLDGRLGEVFLNAGKIGAESDVVARDSAIAVSFALQHGCAAETIRAAFMRDESGKSEGPLGVLFDKIAERTRGAS